MSYFNLQSEYLRESTHSNKQNPIRSSKLSQKQKKNGQYIVTKKQLSPKKIKRLSSSKKLALVSSQKRFKNRPPPQLKKDQKPFQSINFENQYYQFQFSTEHHKNKANIKENIKKNIIQPSKSHKIMNNHKKMRSDQESTNQFKVNSQYSNKITSPQYKNKQKKLKNQEKSSQLSISLMYKERKKKDDPYFIKQRLKKQIHDFKSLQKSHEVQRKILLSPQTKNLTDRQKHRLLKIQTIQKKQLAESIFILKGKLDQQTNTYRYHP